MNYFSFDDPATEALLFEYLWKSWKDEDDKVRPSELPIDWTYAIVDDDGYILNITWTTGDKRRAIYDRYNHAINCQRREGGTLVTNDS